jgi:hypothetical protein
MVHGGVTIVSAPAATTKTRVRGTIWKRAPWVVYWIAVPLLGFEVIARFAFVAYADSRLYFPTLASKVMMSNVLLADSCSDKRYYFRIQPHADVKESNAYFTYTARINSLGFRGAEPSPQEAGEYRVMLLGDSATFGMGLNDEGTIPAQIERVSRENGGEPSRIAAYNFGHLGFNLVQELILLRDYFDTVKPNHVVLILSVYTDNLNDVISGLDADGNFIILKESMDNLVRDISSYYGPLNWSMLFRMFQLKFLSTRIYYKLSMRPDIRQKSFALIDSFQEECRRRGAAFTIVNVYAPDAVKGGLHELRNGSRSVHAMYTKYCRDHNIDTIDMVDFMVGYDDWKNYYFGDGHPNGAGARKIAEVIYREALVRRLGAVGGRSGPSK